MSHLGRDPIPLTRAQVGALLRAVARELFWTLHQVTREIRLRRRHAARIPSPEIREDALYALSHKRTHADGAALFSILPRRRDRNLVRLLVDYELILDFLDNVSERHRTELNGRELHLALIDAVDPTRPPADYYRHHPWKDDGGYLRGLVESCQRRCRELPSFDEIHSAVTREAGRTQVLALNHLPDVAERDSKLRSWAAVECPDEHDLAWYELSGAASASLVVLALLSLATRENLSPVAVEETRLVYWPWMSLVGVMLDSYADQAEDAASGDHSYVGHYPSRDVRVRRLAEQIHQASLRVLSLPDGHKHAVILSSMVAMYLSKDSARAEAAAEDTRRLARAGGSLACLLLPVLRLWRAAYSHRSA